LPTKVHFSADQIIFEEGDKGDTAYLMISGEVWLFQGSVPSQTLLDIKYKGHVFGELALLDNTPRVATAKAKTDVSCMMVSRKEFEKRVADGGSDPIVKSLIQSMTEHKLKQ